MAKSKTYRLPCFDIDSEAALRFILGEREKERARESERISEREKQKQK